MTVSDAYAVLCPTCGAGPGSPCRYTASDSQLLRGLTRVGAGPHPARRAVTTTNHTTPAGRTRPAPTTDRKVTGL